MTALWKLEDRAWTAAATTGFPAEADLHDLIETAPQLLPLAGSPDLVVLGREVRLGSGTADLVAVESGGRLTLIEVKLAANAEARRAVVAQLLSYAAALYGSSVEELDALLSKHLQQRGYASTADAVVQADQTESFDAEEFAATLHQSLAAGRMRLVFVLDEAPEDLTRLVGFLETVTDGLVVDLVTVGSYDIAGTRVIVPQRVEPDPLLRARPSGRVQPASYPKPVKGSEDFEASIPEAAPEHRPRLQYLLEWARQLERDGLATLYTTAGKNRWTLVPRVTGDWAGLVTIWNDKGPGLTLHSGVFARTGATIALRAVRERGIEVGKGTKAPADDNDLVEQLRQAYAEARGPTVTATAG